MSHKCLIVYNNFILLFRVFTGKNKNKINNMIYDIFLFNCVLFKYFVFVYQI